jgi:hypothetical protein
MHNNKKENLHFIAILRLLMRREGEHRYCVKNLKKCTGNENVCVCVRVCVCVCV